MTPRPAVTLLLPNRNNDHVLDLVLARLAEHTTYPSYELVVVDDGSTDGSLDILRRWRATGAISDFTLIEREHGGVVAALNAGLAAASGELVVQLDGDATVETVESIESIADSVLCIWLVAYYIMIGSNVMFVHSLCPTRTHIAQHEGSLLLSSLLLLVWSPQ